MNDSEVMMALSICTAVGSGCDGCPYHESYDGDNCLEQACADAVEIIKTQKDKLEAYECINKLQQADIADRDKMLKQKVEVVYADFMKDYKLLEEECEGLYKENSDQRAEIERLQKALLSINYIAKRIPQTICDNCYPDFDVHGKPVTVFKAREGYTAVDALVEQIVKEAME